MEKDTHAGVVKHEDVREGFWQKYILRANKQHKPKSGFLKRREAKSLKGTRVGDLTVDEKLALGFFVSPEEMEKFEATLLAARAHNGHFSRFAVPQIPQGVAGAWGVPSSGVNASAFTQFGAPSGTYTEQGLQNGTYAQPRTPQGAYAPSAGAPEVEEAEIVGDLTGPVPRMQAGEPLPEDLAAPSGVYAQPGGNASLAQSTGAPDSFGDNATAAQPGTFAPPTENAPAQGVSPQTEPLAQFAAQPPATPVSTPPLESLRKRYSLPKSSGNAAGHWGAKPEAAPSPVEEEKINLQSSNSAAQEIRDLRAQMKFTVENHQVEMAEKDLKIKQLNERIADFHTRVGDMSKVIEKMTNRIISQGGEGLSQESKAKAVFKILDTGHRSYFQDNASLQKVVKDIFEHRFDDVAHETDGQH